MKSKTMSSQKKKNKPSVKVSFDDTKTAGRRTGQVQNHRGADDGAATQANDSFASSGPLHFNPSKPSHVLNRKVDVSAGSLRIAFKQ